MKILLLHHFESHWAAALIRYGTSWELQCEKLAEHLLENKYDKIIITHFDECLDTDEYYEVAWRENNIDDCDMCDCADKSGYCEEREIYHDECYCDVCDSLTGLLELNVTFHPYSYGWDTDSMSEQLDVTVDQHTSQTCNYGHRWLKTDGRHSDFVPLDDWLYELKGHDVALGGAFDGECLHDMQQVLNYLEVEYTRISELIV